MIVRESVGLNPFNYRNRRTSSSALKTTVVFAAEAATRGATDCLHLGDVDMTMRVKASIPSHDEARRAPRVRYNTDN